MPRTMSIRLLPTYAATGATVSSSNVQTAASISRPWID